MAYSICAKEETIFVYQNEVQICDIKNIQSFKKQIPKKEYKWLESLKKNLERDELLSIKNDEFVLKLVEEINTISPPFQLKCGGYQRAFVSKMYALLAWGNVKKQNREAIKSILGDFLEKEPDVVANGRWGYDGGFCSKVWIFNQEGVEYFLSDKEGNGEILITRDITEAIVQYGAISTYKHISEKGKKVLDRERINLRKEE